MYKSSCSGRAAAVVQSLPSRAQARISKCFSWHEPSRCCRCWVHPKSSQGWTVFSYHGGALPPFRSPGVRADTLPYGERSRQVFFICFECIKKREQNPIKERSVCLSELKTANASTIAIVLRLTCNLPTCKPGDQGGGRPARRFSRRLLRRQKSRGVLPPSG